MRKLLLVLFLFTLTSNALAKVKLWKCDLYDNGRHYFHIKIDTDIPQVWIRKNGIWEEYYYEGTYKGPEPLKVKKEYNIFDDSVLLKDDNGTTLEVFDFLLKQNIYPTEDGLIIYCEVIE